MSDELEKLRRHRQALLLAEVAGWLHDMGKFCDVQVEQHSRGGALHWGNDYAYKSVVDDPHSVVRLSREASRLPKPDSLNCVLRTEGCRLADVLPAEAKEMLKSTTLRIECDAYSLAELIMVGTPGFAGHKERVRLLDARDGWVPAALGVSHSEAHHDKQEPAGGQLQEFPNVLVSSPFGREIACFSVGHPERGLSARLKALCWQCPPSKAPRAFIRAVEAEFRDGLGDTRRPINEVTLADWGATVGALFKAALASWVISCSKREIRQWASRTEIDHDLRWRIIWIPVDALGFFGRVAQVADLLARKWALDEALDEVRHFWEDDAPLASQIYRDEVGVAFLAPDLPGDDEQGSALRRLFQEGVACALSLTALAGEVALEPMVGPASKKGLGLDTALAQSPRSPAADPSWVRDQWKGTARDVCTACGLRPQQGGRGLCHTCAERRGERAKEWAENLHTTIWTDEAADANGRLGLLVGRFDLAHWLDGTLVSTLLLDGPADGKGESKNPSFARLRRTWETTRTFWQEVLPAGGGGDLSASAIGQLLGGAGPRLCLVPEGAGGASLEEGHAYDLVLGQVRLSVLPWQGQLISADNLSYVAKLLGARAQVWKGSEEAARFVAERLEAAGTVAWEEPAGYGVPTRQGGRLRLAQVGLERTCYTRAIPILAEPRTFMALVPAGRALDAVLAIKNKYEREMNKVRNRLSLAVGIIYFGRRTPLAAALDAGRRMLARKPDASEVRGWRVVANQSGSAGPEQGHWARWQDLTLQRGQRRARLRISTVMGDGSTEDLWYPYFHIERPAPGNPLAQRTLWCRASCPWELGADGRPAEVDLAHVSELLEGDIVYLAPSTFDYEYLDTTARRFDIGYAGGRRRSAERAQRPYLLEELDELERVWALLQPKGATRTQAYALAALIEAKRRNWGQPRGDDALALPADAAFRRLCEDALATAKWQQRPWHEMARDDRDVLLSAALSGMLSDVLELHLTLGQEEDEE